jgi:hypothetical protein
MSTPKVVKIAIWLVKLYDFKSQYMFNVQNRLKNSKIDKIGLKSSEIGEIRWNCDFGTDFTILTKTYIAL